MTLIPRKVINVLQGDIYKDCPSSYASSLGLARCIRVMQSPLRRIFPVCNCQRNCHVIFLKQGKESSNIWMRYFVTDRSLFALFDGYFFCLVDYYIHVFVKSLHKKWIEFCYTEEKNTVDMAGLQLWRLQSLMKYFRTAIFAPFLSKQQSNKLAKSQ